MSQSRKRTLFPLSITVIALLLYGVFVVFAAPPGSGGYNPGETLNPECAPGDTVPEPCIVQLPSGSSSGWSLSGNTVTGGVAASIDTVFNGVGLNDITMTGPYTGTTTQTWVIVITATGTPDQMEVIIDGDSEYVGDVFPPGPLPVDDGLTLNFGSDTGHTVGDSWEFTMTPASGGTTAFLGTLNNEDLIFKTNNIERMRLLSNGDISLVQYQSPRDDSGSYSPINFLYTDGDGNLMSAPTSLLGGGSFSLTLQDEGSTLTTSTNTINFTGAGVNATNSGGGVVTVDIPGGGSELTLQTNSVTNTNQALLNLIAGTNISLADDGSGNVTINASGGGGGSDGSIYLNDGTLTGNRTLTGANNNLVFNGVNQFAAVTTTNLAGSIIRNISSTEGTFSSFAAYPKSAKQHLSGISADPSFSAGWPAEFMLYDAHDSGLGGGLLEFSGLGIDTDTGITFYSNGGNQYSFPKTDGSAGQTLVTDGSGQLSWQSGGGSDTSIYANNGTLTANRTLNGATNNLTFSNLNQFVLSTPNNNLFTFSDDPLGDGGFTELITRYYKSAVQYKSYLLFNSDFDTSLMNENVTAGFTARLKIEANDGISFLFSTGGPEGGYTFPLTDGTSTQILSTDGSGQISWVDKPQALIGRTSGIISNPTPGVSTETYLGNGAGGSNPSNTTMIGAFAGANTAANFGSTFIGYNAGNDANAASDSFFGGKNSGYNADGAGSAVFLGNNSGYEATNADESVFIGLLAGSDAASAAYSNFIGSFAGYQATNARRAIFIGSSAGTSDPVNNTGNLNDFSILIGHSTSTGGFSNSIALGGLATNTASNQLQIGSTTRPISSIFVGDSKGTASTDNTFFVGNSAGFNASAAIRSNFLGKDAGAFATNASESNFFGMGAGASATNAAGSNFLGSSAGQGAINANSSNFFGYSAGKSATSAYNSNFFGEDAGRLATNAYESFFAGNAAGKSATSARHSIFIGSHAGDLSANSSNSIFLGDHAGYSGLVDNTTDPDDYSILLGTYTSAAGFSNSIALGQRATNTASNQFMIGSATRPINTLILTGASGNTCTLDVTVASPSCSSDERLKTNITDLENALEKVIRIRTVNYNWINFPDAGSQIGFLAQDLEQHFPEVVSDAPNGFKTVSYGGMTPILVEAIRELNLKVTNLALLTQGSEDTETLKSSLRNWFADAANGITEIIAGTFRARNQLCVGETCLNETQVQQILQVIQSSPQNNIIIQNPGSGNSDDNNDPDDQNLDDENQSDDESDQTSTDQNNTDNSGSDDSTPVVVE